MKKLIVLLFIALIEVECRGIDSGSSNGDPAPGRSPGPPNQKIPQKSLLGSMYKIDSQSTADFPALVLNKNTPVSTSEAIKNNFNENIFSSVSYDNLKTLNDNKGSIADDTKNSMQINTNDNNRLMISAINNGEKLYDEELNARALHALKETPSTPHQNGRLDNGTNDEYATKASSNKDNDIKMPCMFGNNRNEKVNKYLKSGERIVRVNVLPSENINDIFKYSSTQSSKSTVDVSSSSSSFSSSSTEPATSINPHSSTVKATENFEQATQTTLQIDVIHDVFSTQNGILVGIVYKVEITKPTTSDDIDDFIIETKLNNIEAFGEFLSSTNNDEMNFYYNLNLKNDENQNQNKDDKDSTFGWEEQLWNIDKTKYFNEAWSKSKHDDQTTSENSNKFRVDEFFKTINDCEKHVVYHRLSDTNSKRKIVFNWTISSDNFKSSDVNGHKNMVNFRLLYRKKDRREIYEQNQTLNLLQECSLTLKAFSGVLDSALIPFEFKNCTIHFKPMNQTQLFEQTPGLVVKLTRLNVPCQEGGYVQFNETIKMCGKLEEITEDQRTMYFKSFANTSINTYNYPKFNFIYKLVDTCYDVKLMEPNNSFSIKPTHMTLECYFKIHLPFGYQISLNLFTNNNERNFSNLSQDLFKMETIELSAIRKSKSSILTNEIDNVRNYDNGAQSCLGLFIEIINRAKERWIHCVNASSIKTMYKLITSDNVLDVRVKKHHNNQVTTDASDIPTLHLEYSAIAIESIVSQCAFGWILVGQFCVSAVNELLTWQESENDCNQKGGHLASIRSENEQVLIDKLLINSPNYNEHVSYWIGATDKYFEGDFRWTDGLPFSFSKWFSGWQQHGNYNRQPNDDGLSEQDCVELRRHFHKPSGYASTTSLTESFMWNDRDCDTQNFFLCERPLTDEPTNNMEIEDCNKTIYLSREKMKITFTSPGFPRFYPDKINCLTFIAAPTGYRILIDFEEMVLEYEPHCSYDFLEIFEPIQQQNSRVARHSPAHRKQLHNQIYDLMVNNLSNLQQQQQQLEEEEFQRLQEEYLAIHQNPETDYQFMNILQPSNRTYNTHMPPPNNKNEKMPRKICGDWSSKLKLLRYETKGHLLGIRFVSDYSHHFGGFKAKISMEKASSECINERLKPFNESCYLFISFPEVDWWTAQQICRSLGAQLSSVRTPEEHRFIISNIRNNLDYTPRSFYWLGGEYTKSKEFEWTDGTKMSFQGWLPGQDQVDKNLQESICLGLQWKISPTPMLPSGLYWAFQKCNSIGGYVCKQNKKNNVFIQNQTVTGTEGRFTSPDYPNPYSSNINYWIKIIAPEKSRIIVQFQKIDIEYQAECLYDYVSIQDSNYDIQSSMNQYNEQIKLTDEEDYQNDHIVDEVEDVSTTFKYEQHSDYKLDKKRSIHSIAKRFTELANNKTVNVSTSNVTNIPNLSMPSFEPYVRWCGTFEGDMSKFDFVSSTNEIMFNFFTDYSVGGEGFSATWSSIDTSACPGQIITSREGSINSPNYPHFLLHNLDCTYTIIAPSGKKIWLEFTNFDFLSDASVYVDLGQGLFEPYQTSHLISDGAYASIGEKVKIILKTGLHPRGRGFKATFKTLNQITEQRVIMLTNFTFGNVYHLNYPQKLPPNNIDFTQHFIAPLGEIISIELQGVRFNDNGCEDNSSIEVYDNYADKNGTSWQLCRAAFGSDSSEITTSNERHSSVIFITSYLNTVHIRQQSVNGGAGVLNGTIRIQSDINYKLKLISTSDEWVESCQPNPCKFGGRCITNGTKHLCQCRGHYTGRFCGLNMCEFDPCVFGQCELTVNSFKCHCQSGYMGLICDQRRKPCSDNPCEGRGECFERNGGFFCRCHAWWEGTRCEKRMMHIPYKPLSERMLEEPFWLGLITVFIVLAVIGLVWCAKRHFPEKIEKLLAEEADRNRPASGHSHHHHISLREQLGVAGAAMNSTMQAPNVTTPGQPKSIFGRLGIRKPSILSLSSPQPPPGSTARTFSLDDLLRPPPRRTPSPRKKRNNSTPTRKNANEKKQILQQLISPNANHNQVTLGELIQLSENNQNTTVVQNHVRQESEEQKETTFSEGSAPASTTASTLGLGMLTRPFTDPKLEKKVTFARLLSKMSAEITSGSDGDAVNGTNHSSALSLPTDVQLHANSVPQSPCTNDNRSPHSTSSTQGSDSLSSSELALHDLTLRCNRRIRPKVSSADSILAMFKNFATSNAALNMQSSLRFSPTTTPTASSPVGDDESDDSSLHTPVSFSSGAPDSPVFYRPSTIEVPVLDAISAHKNHNLSPSSSTTSNSSANHLVPPSIMLEIPGSINKCLSPIRELPTPIPSPALTPIMPRPHRITKSSIHHDETISVMFSDEDYKNDNNGKQRIVVDLQSEINHADSDNESATVNTSSESNLSSVSVRRPRLCSVPAISIDVRPPTPLTSPDEVRTVRAERPKDLIIPELIIQTPSPTKERLPVVIFPGSPPPQRASIGETSGLFPNRQQQKRLIMQMEKPGSLDFPFVPPMITITANLSELESDAELMSPATIKVAPMNRLCVPHAAQMTYLSPFSISARGDRAPSEGNLSSSGYSSMASPGPSRCNSNNPLCPNEMEDGGTGSGNHGMNIAVPPRRQMSLMKKCGEFITTGASNGGANEHFEQFRRRSDSETLSDEALLESNDEGIGTDHLDEKIEDGDIKSAKELELYIGKELIESGRNMLNQSEEPVTMSQLQLPSIVIQSEGSFDKLSPVSSRSESPLSERNGGIGRFSPQFYGKKDQQLPFTDSDGLYDFPSSDGKGGTSTNVQHRKSTGKRRERKSSKSSKNDLSNSPSKNSVHLEIPHKTVALNQTSKYHTTNVARKSPKRRPLQRYTPSSSSSAESLTGSTTRDNSMPSIKLRDTLIESIELKQYGNVSDDANKYGSGSLPIHTKRPSSEPTQKISNVPPKKMSRLKAIGNQIRFLRRLEQALKERDRLMSPSDEDGSDILDSPKATSPLLSTSSAANNNNANKSKMSRQSRVYNKYTFEPGEQEHNSLVDKDFMSD